MFSDIAHDKIKYIPDKVVLIMVDRREYLPFGTTLQLETGNIYEITGAPVGYGGGSILYPARRLVIINDKVQSDGFSYVLKECFPVSGYYNFVRSESGEIVPQSNTSESKLYLDRAKKLLLKEETVSHAIYQTASRVMPIRESASQVVLRLPGKAATSISNTVTVMESLTEKGNSITTWIKDNKRFSPFQTFRIIQQLLFALREVHQAGYLHLDIQDGNIFLKGTLEQKDELVTLIDFGSARPMVDGKTAPIQDQVIFTTPGFSAPEIMLNNDGTLQLGAETDIYSVGCLALYLLTGRKPDTRALLENRTGIYLKPNQLRRIKCPKHLVDRMQQILATALERNIGKRYHSIDEMLQDVTDFVEALQPYRTDLSAVKYDAFICYKHGPIDSEAAVTLQRELENYRAPKGVSKSRKPFKRVFVDEGELSSCADFGQQIREALRNSGWLIVVCSEDTPNSPWVQLEIDTFLETHSRSRVLCVMTGGDEKVSFPPQLKGNQTDEGEVLAAEARGSDLREVKKKLRKDALLKIAAPMLGTTFDSLKQRHKLYQMQRVAVVTAGILAATVGFAAYAVNRAHVIAEQAARIEQEYENALINESLFLAEQAQKRLDDNDPLGAVELALKALPSEAQDRPVLTEAEYVLGEALGIYTTPDSVRDTVTPVGVFDSAYKDFFLSLDGKYLITWGDIEEGIQIVETDTMTVVRNVNLAYYPIQLSSDYLLYQHRIIIPVPDSLDEEKVCCIDYLLGTTIWEVPAEDLIGVGVTQDKTKFIVVSGKQDFYYENYTAETDMQELTISTYFTSSGELLDQIIIKLDVISNIDNEIFISPDGDWLAFCANFDDADSIFQSYNSVYAVSLKTGEYRKLTAPDAYLCTAWLEENKLFAIRSTGESYVFDYQRMGLEPVTYLMESYDLETGIVQWSIPYQCYDAYAFESLITSIPVRYVVEQEKRNGVLYVFSNLCVLIDEETGNVVKKYNMNSAILDVSCDEGGFQAVCADGSIYSVQYQDDMVRKFNFFDDRITAFCRYDSTCYVQNCFQYETNYSIRKYEFEKYDDSYVRLFDTEDESWGIFFNYHAVDGGYQFTLAQSDNIRIVDTSNGDDRIYAIPSEYGFSPFYNTLGFSPDRTKLYWEKYESIDEKTWINNKQYYCLDMTTGQITTLSQPEKPSEDMRVRDAAFDGENLFFIASEYHNMGNIITVWSWNIEDNKLEERYRSTADDGFGSIISPSLFLNEDDTGLWFATQEREYDYKPFVGSKPVKSQAQLVYLDLTTGKATKILLDLPPETYASLYADGLYWWNDSASIAAVVFDNTLYVLDKNGSLIFQSVGNETITSIWFSPDNGSLFVINQNGILSRYNVYDGTLLSSLDLTEYSEYFQTVLASSYRWEYHDPEILAVSVKEECILIDISNNNMKIKATIDQYFAYDSHSDKYLVVTTDNLSGATEIGYFLRYSVDDLIRKANAILS